MANTNSHSIKQDPKMIEPTDLRPGDMFVQNNNGGIGHVSVIVDVTKSKPPGKPDPYRVGFSFMPAREFHIERSPTNNGWFPREEFAKLPNQHRGKGDPVLRRFSASIRFVLMEQLEEEGYGEDLGIFGK